MIKQWLTIIRSDANKLLRLVYCSMKDCSIRVRKRNNWVLNIKELLYSTRFGYVWEQQTVNNEYHILLTLIVYKLFKFSYLQYYLALFGIHICIMLNDIMYSFPCYPCLTIANGLTLIKIYMLFFHLICCTQFITCTLHVPSPILTTNRIFFLKMDIISIQWNY